MGSHGRVEHAGMQSRLIRKAFYFRIATLTLGSLPRAEISSYGNNDQNTMISETPSPVPPAHLGEPRGFPDPLHILGDLGVDAVLSRLGALLTPAGDPCQKPGLPDAVGVGPATVPPTRVLAPGRVAGTEHALQDGGGGALQAGHPVHEGHGEHLQDDGGAAAVQHAAPAAHRARPVAQQVVGEVPAADADGGDVAVEGERLVQLQQSDVIVVLVPGAVVGGVREDFNHLPPLLCVVVLLRVVFTCGDKGVGLVTAVSSCCHLSAPTAQSRSQQCGTRPVAACIAITHGSHHHR